MGVNAAYSLSGPQAKDGMCVINSDHFEEGVIYCEDLAMLVQDGYKAANCRKKTIKDRVVARFMDITIKLSRCCTLR